MSSQVSFYFGNAWILRSMISVLSDREEDISNPLSDRLEEIRIILDDLKRICIDQQTLEVIKKVADIAIQLLSRDLDRLCAVEKFSHREFESLLEKKQYYEMIVDCFVVRPEVLMDKTAQNRVEALKRFCEYRKFVCFEDIFTRKPMSDPSYLFRQHMRNVSPVNDKYKTELCRNFEENGVCPYGERCQFSHGELELRESKRPKEIKKLCRAYHLEGYCSYGPRCRFVHEEIFPELRRLPVFERIARSTESL